jgi:hypothetical protein
MSVAASFGEVESWWMMEGTLGRFVILYLEATLANILMVWVQITLV